MIRIKNRLFIKVLSALMVAVISASGVMAYDNLGVDVSVSIQENNFPYVNGFIPPTTGLGGFVTRLYQTIMERNPDREGFNYWYNALSAKTRDAKQAAESFFNSVEFTRKTLTNQQYLDTLYRLFFDRAPDAAGNAYWLGQLNSGKDRKWVRDAFYNEQEWKNICLSYNVNPGVPLYSTTIASFVNRFYSLCYGRTADTAGRDYWGNALMNGTVTGKVCAKGFIFSPEFSNRIANMTNEQIVNIFYRVFFDRTPSAAETYWVDQLDSGYGLPELFYGFADSAEFATICDSYGIVCGPHIDVGHTILRPTISDPDFAAFYNLYRVQLGVSRLEQARRSPHYTYTLSNVQGTSTATKEVTISDADLDAIRRFAASHFESNWTAEMKVAYTLYWIHNNVTYAAGSSNYAVSIFDNRRGQCAQYNGALVEMMCYLGYDANLILGWRGTSMSNKWQHYWGEVTINGEIFVMEAGEQQWPSWYHLASTYTDATKYIKNGEVQH